MTHVRRPTIENSANPTPFRPATLRFPGRRVSGQECRAMKRTESLLRCCWPCRKLSNQKGGWPELEPPFRYRHFSAVAGGREMSAVKWILLQKSKIERPRKSRESRFLDAAT